MGKLEKFAEALSLTGWWVESNKEDILFEFKEPKALLKQCRNKEFKAFIKDFHSNLCATFLVSSCYISSMVIITIILAVVSVVVLLFFPSLLKEIASSSSSKSKGGLKGWFIFFGALILIFTFFSLFDEASTILITRYLCSTITIRKRGLVVAGTNHAEWHEIKSASALKSILEPENYYIIIETSIANMETMEFALSLEDTYDLINHLKEHNIDCSSTEIDSIIDKIIITKGGGKMAKLESAQA